MFTKFPQQASRSVLVHTKKISEAYHTSRFLKRPTCPYTILNLQNNATEKEIKNSFFALAKKLHPDVGGNEENYIKLREAYETLSQQFRREEPLYQEVCKDQPPLTIEKKEHKITRDVSIPYTEFKIHPLSVVFSNICALPNGTIVVCHYSYDYKHTAIEILDLKNERLTLLTTIPGQLKAITTKKDSSFVIGMEHGDIHVINLKAGNAQYALGEEGIDLKAPFISTFNVDPKTIFFLKIPFLKITNLAMLPDDNTLICIYCNEEYSMIQRWNLHDQTLVSEKRLRTGDERHFQSTLAVLSSKEGCYILRHSYGTLELRDAQTLDVIISYDSSNQMHNDIRLGCIKALDDGKHFICEFTSWKKGGAGVIAIGSIDNPKLQILGRNPCGYCLTSFLSNGLLASSLNLVHLEKDAFLQVEDLPISECRASICFEGIANNQLLVMGENGIGHIYDCSKATKAQNLDEVLRPWLVKKPQEVQSIKPLAWFRNLFCSPPTTANSVLPILIIFERHWDKIPKQVLLHSLTELAEIGYSTLCLEAPSTLNSDELMYRANTELGRADYYHSAAMRYLTKYQVRLDEELSDVSFSTLMEMMRLYVSSKQFSEVSYRIKNYPALKLMKEILEKTSQLGITLEGVDIDVKSYDGMLKGGLSSLAKKLELHASPRNHTIASNLLALHAKQKGIIFMCGAEHATALISLLEHAKVGNNLLYYFPHSSARFEANIDDLGIIKQKIAAKEKFILLSEEDEIKSFSAKIIADVKVILENQKPSQSASHRPN